MLQFGGPHFFAEETPSLLQDIVPSVNSVSEIETIVNYNTPYAQMHIVNDGANTVHYAFDQTVEANDTFLKLDSGESKIYYGEFTTAHFICAAGETASVRLEAR